MPGQCHLAGSPQLRSLAPHTIETYLRLQQAGASCQCQCPNNLAPAQPSRCLNSRTYRPLSARARALVRPGPRTSKGTVRDLADIQPEPSVPPK